MSPEWLLFLGALAVYAGLAGFVIWLGTRKRKKDK